jgi:hypothetical protein
MITKVDYTKMRRNSMIANKYICVCPKCGKRGLRFCYPANDGQQVQEYMHEGERTLQGVEMTKSCQVVIEVTAKES